MGVAGLVAALAGRPARRWYALLLAAAVTLALNPRAAGEPGWQLSFAAVAALLVGAPPLRAALARRMPGPVADAAAITIAATLGTAPLMALHFEQVSLAALPANLLAAPAIAPVMWLGVLAAAAAQVAEPLAAPFTALAARCSSTSSRSPTTPRRRRCRSSSVHASPAVDRRRLGAASLVAAVARCAAGSAVARLAARPRARGRAVAARSPLAATAAVAASRCGGSPARGSAPAPPGADEVVVSFLDVGQGDATLIQRGGTAVLVDTGPPDGPILERLERGGVERLDALMLTHAEADHEGAAPAGDRARPRRGWSSTAARAGRRACARAAGRGAGARRARARRGRDDRARPPAVRGPVAAAARARLARRRRPERHALVPRLEAGGSRVLLAADAESGVTAALRARAGGRAEGRPPRQRRPRPARAARADQAAGRGDRGRQREHLRASRRRRRSPRCSGRARP